MQTIPTNKVNMMHVTPENAIWVQIHASRMTTPNLGIPLEGLRPIWSQNIDWTKGGVHGK